MRMRMMLWVWMCSNSCWSVGGGGICYCPMHICVCLCICIVYHAVAVVVVVVYCFYISLFLWNGCCMFWFERIIPTQWCQAAWLSSRTIPSRFHPIWIFRVQFDLEPDCNTSITIVIFVQHSHMYWLLTCNGSWTEPGTAGTPVMKSFVMKGRSTTDLLQDGVRLMGSRSKCTGMRTTGICEILRYSPACMIIWNYKWNYQNLMERSIVIIMITHTSLAMASACRSCASTTVFSVVCVMSVSRYCTGSPKI